MSKKVRDYIFIFFIIFFILGTVLTSLYASGYRINLSWPPKFNRLLVKTGMLNLDTNPRGADIYLNGQVRSSAAFLSLKKDILTTPTKIRNLLPGEYDLILERKGYWPFQKKVNVYSGQTTFVENINLFRSDLPLFLISAKAGELKISVDHKYLYSAVNGKIINLKTDQEITAAGIGGDQGEWLLNSEKLLTGGHLIDPEKNTDFDYNGLIGAEADDWYYDESINRIYYRYRDSLAYLEIAQNTGALIARGENYLTYEPRGEEIFFVATSDGKTILKKYSFKTQKIEQQSELPGVGHYRFIHDRRPILTLYDEQNKTLYLIDPTNLNSKKTIKNIVSWQWINDESLIYNNNWEIYSFDLKKNSATLITRVGEEVDQIVWNENNDYLIFSGDNGLNALDLKSGVITNIFKTEKISSPVLDDKNSVLYFWAQIGQQEGIYKMILQ